jgi:hypothetical protein
MGNRDLVIDMLPKHGIGVEIGVWKGEFSQRLLSGAMPNELVLIDPWKFVPEYEVSFYGNKNMNQSKMDSIYNGVVRRFKHNKHVHVIRSTSFTMRTSDIRPIFKGKNVDWVYIDGDHSYKGVLDDLMNSIAVLKAGGVIAGDDYALGGWWKDGVIQAVADFMEIYPPTDFKTLGSQFFLTY